MSFDVRLNMLNIDRGSFDARGTVEEFSNDSDVCFIHFLLLGLVSITRHMPRPRHKNKAIIRLSSHPLRLSLCFNSKLVVVVVVFGLMETRLNEHLFSCFYHGIVTDILVY